MTPEEFVEDEEKVNTFLDIFQGRCRHEWEVNPLKGKICHKCGYFVNNFTNSHNLNYFSPAIFVEVLKPWMEKERPGLWHDYLEYLGGQKDYFQHCYCQMLHNILNPCSLTRFLIKNRKEWEWVECKGTGSVKGCDYPKCLSPMKETRTSCKEGKVKHPAAQWLDEQEIK